MSVVQHRIEWKNLQAFEPSLDEVRAHATALAAAYNHPANAPLLGHTEALGEDDVIEHYTRLFDQHARPFLFLRDGALAGDGDLRHVTVESAEFAFLIADPAAQGQGLGTRFATMVHAFAFTQLALAEVYASVIPANVASRRVFEKLGYSTFLVPDTREVDPGDLALVVTRTEFVARHAAAMAEIAIAVR
jgi:RimJ/RimL family protein N-acetyltransferase